MGFARYKMPILSLPKIQFSTPYYLTDNTIHHIISFCQYYYIKNKRRQIQKSLFTGNIQNLSSYIILHHISDNPEIFPSLGTIFFYLLQPGQLSWNKADPEFPLLLFCLRVPAAVQGAVFCFANIFVQASVNSFGAGATSQSFPVSTL